MGNKRTYFFAYISHHTTALSYTVSHTANRTNTITSNNAPDFGSNSRSYGRFIHVEPYRQPNKCDRLAYSKTYTTNATTHVLSDNKSNFGESYKSSYRNNLVTKRRSYRRYRILEPNDESNILHSRSDSTSYITDIPYTSYITNITNITYACSSHKLSHKTK